MRDAADAAREKAREVKEEATRSARENAERGSERWTSMASDQILAVCSAMQAAAERLHDEDQPKIGKWVDDAASEIQRFAGYLDDEDPSAIMHDVEGMARKNTGAFLGTAFAAGMAMGRFLRSSERDSSDAQGERESPRSPDPTAESDHGGGDRHEMGRDSDEPEPHKKPWSPHPGVEEPVAPTEIR